MIFFRILLQNTFLHLLSNFSVSKVSITWTRAQTVTELGGNRANLMRQIRKNVAKKRYTISKSSEILRWIYDFFRILIWNTLSHTMLSFGVSRFKGEWARQRIFHFVFRAYSFYTYIASLLNFKIMGRKKGVTGLNFAPELWFWMFLTCFLKPFSSAF